MASSKPSRLAAHIHERVMLENPSPMKAILFPSQPPSFSWMVRRSARIWQGCSSSVRALMVGMPENSAKSTTSCWAKVRMIAPWTMRPSTRAVSLIGSPRPSWMSFLDRNIGKPPSSRMPTSKETRVRVEDLVKMSAHVCPESCEPSRPRWSFRCAADSNRFSISLALSWAMERRCFIGKVIC